MAAVAYKFIQDFHGVGTSAARIEASDDLGLGGGYPAGRFTYVIIRTESCCLIIIEPFHHSRNHHYAIRQYRQSNMYPKLMKGLLLFLILFEILRLIRYHRGRRRRYFSTITTLRHGQSSDPTYEACKIYGGLIIAEDYSKGLFFYLISPYYEDILAAFPSSTLDSVAALRWSPEGTQFLGFAVFIIHLSGTETGGAFIRQHIPATLDVSSLQMHNMEDLLKSIKNQLKVQCIHDNRVQLLPEYLFGGVERDVVIETSGFGEVKFEIRMTRGTISGAGTLGRFRVTTKPTVRSKN